MSNLPEIHDKEPFIHIPLGKVGVIGVKMPIGFAYFENKPIIVVPSFSVFIDLPANQKGIHASRNYEIITEVLEEFAGKTYKLENICSAISNELLRRHEYATRSEVKAVGEAMVEKQTPITNMTTYEPCKMMALAVTKRNPKSIITVKRMVGVSVTGITACPCAQEVLKESVIQEIYKRYPSHEEWNKILDEIPWASHMQRSKGTLITEVPEGFEIEASKLVSVIEKSMSATSYELLKRADEVELVKQALENPRFVEDCIRMMMKNFAESFPKLPDSVLVIFKQRSKEVIHKYDFFAERTLTLGEIRRELANRT